MKPDGAGTADGVRIRDHLAAVRTLLAWHRAAVALLGIAVVASRIREVHAGDNRDVAVALTIVAVIALLIAAGQLLRTRDRLEAGALASRPTVLLGALVLVGVGGAVVLIAVVRAGG